jgi:hypothetical protein
MTTVMTRQPPRSAELHPVPHQPRRVAYDHRHLATKWVGREARQLIQLIVRPPLLDHYVLALYESRLVQAQTAWPVCYAEIRSLASLIAALR